MDDLTSLLRRLRAVEQRLDRSSVIDRPRPLVARYQTAVAQPIANATLTIVQYDTVTFDPFALVTTGAAWKFTAPITGYYHILAAACFQSTTAWALGEAGEIRAYVSGVQQSILDRDDKMNSATVAQFKALFGGDLVYLAAGAFVDVRIIHTAGVSLNLHNAATLNYVSIHKIN